MKDNKNGFTLIELIVCIGIIAALGIVVGLNSNDVVDKATISKNESVYEELFDAASVYAELSSNRTICSSRCNVTIQRLIDAGLLEKTILETKNPIYSGDIHFMNNNRLYIQFNSGVKIVEFRCPSDSEKNITSENINDYEWGKCN